MEIRTKVRVTCCLTGHEFEDGEIVERHESQYDFEYKDSVGFIASDGSVWYMIPDEYEIVQDDD